jgi:hypothetical protein
MILTGIIHTIFEEEIISPKFRKTVMWLQEANEEQPQVWEISFFNNDGRWLNKYDAGQLVNVNIAVLGRLVRKNGEDRVYNTIRGVKIQELQSNKNAT